MGDVSAEPSMEDILSSIKRIIAEEDTPKVRSSPPARSIRAVEERPIATHGDEPDTILELSDPIGDRDAAVDQASDTLPPSPAPAAAIVSDQTATVTRSALEALSKLMVKPEPSSDGTLEGLVRELLRPMLREWIDANLPAMVETMVSREINKITGMPR